MKKQNYINRLRVASLITGVIFMSIYNNADAQMQGPNYGLTTSVKANHYPSWENTPSICFADSQYTSVALSPGMISDTMRIGSFHFNIPENASVEGITVTISKGAIGSGVTDNMVKLIYNGVICGSNHASLQEWPLHAANYTYGGEADQWNIDLTPAIINSYTFGIALSVSNSANNANMTNKANIDFVNVCVKYKVSENKITFCPTGNNKKLKYYHYRRYKSNID